MTIATVSSLPAVHDRHAPAARDQRSTFVLHDVSWETYESLLNDLQEQHVRLTYDRGTLELMAPPLPVHDRSGRLLARLIYAYSETLGIPLASFGGTTWRRRAAARGLEADECFYVQNEPRIRGRDHVDLEQDPPPDVAIEVDITHSTLETQAIYAALGVPELWRYEDDRLTVYMLHPDGRYAPAGAGAAFPALPAAEVQRFMHLRGTTGETELVVAFRDWVRATFLEQG